MEDILAGTKTERIMVGSRFPNIREKENGKTNRSNSYIFMKRGYSWNAPFLFNNFSNQAKT
jgi:hypothetical protein